MHLITGDCQSEPVTEQSASSDSQSTRTYGVLAVLVIGVLAAIQSADPGITNIAMPSVSKALNITGSGLSFAVSIATLTLAATVIIAGALADRLGVRKIIMYGLVLEIVGNLIVAVAPALGVLLLGRAIAGVGMGALFAGAFSMVPVIAGKKSIASVIGQWTGFLYIFTILFSILGSGLIAIGWRAAFLLIPILCLIMLFVVPKTLPETPPRGAKKFDFPGLSVLGIGMVLVLISVSLAATALGSPLFWGTLILGILFLAGFAIIEAKSGNAAFPIDLFKSPVFVAAVFAGILWNFGESGMLLQVSNFWQLVTGVSPAIVGLAAAPLLIAGIISGFLVGALLGKGFSPVLMTVIGFVLMIGGFISISFTTVDSKMLEFFPALIAIGLGMVAVAVVQAREYVAEAPPKYQSAVVSSRTAVGQLGYSLGVALTTSLIAIRVAAEGSTFEDPAAFVPAFNSTMKITAAILLIGGLITVILLGIGLKKRKLAAATMTDVEPAPSSGNQPLG